MPTQRCPKCKGTGMIGDRLVVGGKAVHLDVECSRCKGKGYITRRGGRKKK